MAIMHFIRRNSGTLARINTALFGLIWLSIVAAPCAMALQIDRMDVEHICAHCPPPPCHEVQPDECDEPERLDSPRAGEKAQQAAILPTPPAARFTAGRKRNTGTLRSRATLPRAGPRAHLVHVRFNE